VNQRATIEEAVFSVGAVPRLYNEDLRQLELELRESPELAVGRIMERKELGVIDFLVCCGYSETLMNPLPGNR
jgi:hypothetical protein